MAEHPRQCTVYNKNGFVNTRGNRHACIVRATNVSIMWFNHFKSFPNLRDAHEWYVAHPEPCHYVVHDSKIIYAVGANTLGVWSACTRGRLPILWVKNGLVH